MRGRRASPSSGSAGGPVSSRSRTCCESSTPTGGSGSTVSPSRSDAPRTRPTTRRSCGGTARSCTSCSALPTPAPSTACTSSVSTGTGGTWLRAGRSAVCPERGPGGAAPRTATTPLSTSGRCRIGPRRRSTRSCSGQRTTSATSSSARTTSRGSTARTTGAPTSCSRPRPNATPCGSAIPTGSRRTRAALSRTRYRLRRGPRRSSGGGQAISPSRSVRRSASTARSAANASWYAARSTDGSSRWSRLFASATRRVRPRSTRPRTTPVT